MGAAGLTTGTEVDAAGGRGVAESLPVGFQSAIQCLDGRAVFCERIPATTIASEPSRSTMINGAVSVEIGRIDDHVGDTRIHRSRAG